MANFVRTYCFNKLEGFIKGNQEVGSEGAAWVYGQRWLGEWLRHVSLYDLSGDNQAADGPFARVWMIDSYLGFPSSNISEGTSYQLNHCLLNKIPSYINIIVISHCHTDWNNAKVVGCIMISYLI